MKMKKIIALLLMVWSTAYGQVYTPMAQNYEFKRHVKIDSTLNMAQAYADTGAANAAGAGLVAGRMIRIGNDFLMRNAELTAWLQFVNIGPGSTSSDAVWETDGNYSATDPTTFKLGHIDSFPLRFYTNDVKRLEIPAAGIQSVNGSQYRYLVYDTSGKAVGYTEGLDTVLFDGTMNANTVGHTTTAGVDTTIVATQHYVDSVAGGGGGSGWSLTGNAGTDTSVNFFGTTDNRDIIIKRNNIRYGYYGVNSTGLGLYSLKYGNTGANNTSIGNYSMFNLTTGTQNTAVGFSSLSELTTGDYNVGIGQGANRTTTGTGNVGVGYASLSSLTIGSYNVAVGTSAGDRLTIGGKNTLIGDSATTINSSTDSSVAIGYFAVSSTKQLAFSPHLTTMFLDLDSASGTAPAIAGIDKDGNWRKYATPSGGSTAIPNNEVAFGNGTGITSNSDFFYSTGSGGLFNVGFSGNVILQKTGNNYYFGDKDGINNQTYLHVNDGSKLVTVNADSLKLGSVKVALQAIDSTASPINMIYQGTDGLLHKAAVPSGSGGSPAGNYGNIQINRNGAFDTPGGDSLSFNESIQSFTIIGGFRASDATNNETPISSYIKTTSDVIFGDQTNGVYIQVSGSNADNILRLYSTGGNPMELHDDVTVIGNITAHNIIGATATQTDANFSATAGTAYVLSGNNSATRTITMPTLAEGDVFEFYNENTSANKWVSSATIYLSDNTTFTTLADDTNYILRYVGGKLRVSN